MKKRTICIFALVLVFVLALFAFTACNTGEVPFDTELVTNGDFSESTATDKDKIVLDGWSVSSTWDVKKSAYELKYSSDGEQFLKIENSTAGYAYLYQQIKVDRRATYKVTVDIKLDGSVKKGSDEEYYGAYISFLENVTYRFQEQREYYNNPETSNWKTVTFYVSPSNTDYLTIMLALGGENAASRGTAFFDNVSVMKVSSVPDGATVTNFKKSDVVRYNVNVSGILFVTLLCLFSVLVLVGAYVLLRRLYAKQNAFLNYDKVVSGTNNVVSPVKKAFAHPAFIATALAVGTFLVNLIFLLSMYGFGSEMNYTVNLALKLASKGGVANAYTVYASSLQSTAPGALYVLAIIGAMGKNLPYSDIAVLIRMVNVLATMATVVMIYFYGRKYVGDRTSTIFAAMYALLPITLIMGGLDHTFTALLVALLVGAMILLVEKKFLATYLVMALAVVLDVRALALAPLAVAYIGYRYYRDDSNLKKFTKNRAIMIFGLVGAVVAVYLLTLPASINFVTASQSKPFYGFNLIANQIINNRIMTDNGLGLYGLATMNGKYMNNLAAIFNLVFMLVLVVYVAYLYFKNRNKQEILLLASFTFAVIGVFTLKVDYTYLFLALALGFIYTMVSGEKRMYGILGAYSVLLFLNIGQLMSNSGFVASTVHFDDFFRSANAKAYFANYETTSPEFIVFSIFAVLVTIYYIYVSYSITNKGKRVDIPAMYDTFKNTVISWAKDFPSRITNLFKKQD